MSRFALLIAVAACGVEIGEPPGVPEEGGKGDGTGSGAMPLTATGFLTRIGTQFCDEAFRCKATYPEGATAFATDFGATTSECYTGAIAFYTPQLVEQSITAGRLTYNASSAKLCLSGIVYEPDCAVYWQVDQPKTFPSSCNTALLGTVADGGACTTDFDCANAGSLCDEATKQCAAAI